MNYYQREHEPVTPPAAEAKLEAYSDALDGAVEALRQARDDEVAAEEDRDAAKRAAQMSPTARRSASSMASARPSPSSRRGSQTRSRTRSTSTS